MEGIRNIRLIDHKPSARLSPTPQEGDEMKGQKGYALVNPVPRSGISLSTLARAAWRQFIRWQQLAKQRRQLATLNDAALKDMGLNRGDVFRETERPFWDDPLANSMSCNKSEY
jgi:uncharacterized protein YjiS (DUF1127 family)